MQNQNDHSILCGKNEHQGTPWEALKVYVYKANQALVRNVYLF